MDAGEKQVQTEVWSREGLICPEIHAGIERAQSGSSERKYGKESSSGKR